MNASISKSIAFSRVIRSKTAQFSKIIKSKWRKVVTGDEKKRIRDMLMETQEKPEYIKLFDKIAFTLGVLNIGVCQYFLLNIPHWFFVWFTFVTPLLLFARYHHFKFMEWEYFMFDFCYFANICMWVNLYLLPSSLWFSNVCFIYAFGPLPFAIVLWRNSLVFHDYDKITSVYIHILPTMLMYVARFHGHYTCHSLFSYFFPQHHGTCNIFLPTSQQTHLRMSDVWYAILGYALWQLVYFVKTEVMDKKKLDQCPKKLTSLRWLSKDMKNPFVINVIKICRRCGIYRKNEVPDSTSVKTKLVFVMVQFLYTILTFLPTLFLYRSAFFSLLFIGTIFTISIYYGASYYIEVFSTRYQWQIAKEKPRTKSDVLVQEAVSGVNVESVHYASSLEKDVDMESDVDELESESESSEIIGDNRGLLEEIDR